MPCMQRKRRGAWLALGLAATLLGVLVGPAPAATVKQARRQLLDADLTPDPLFPARFPRHIAGAQADLTFPNENQFDIEFTHQAHGGFTMIVDYGRGPRRQLHQMLHFTKHVQRDPVRRIRVGTRTVYYGQGDVTFYLAWREQGMTYYAESKYYGASLGDLKVLVRSAQPL
jgi:hypothetical protein